RSAWLTGQGRAALEIPVKRVAQSLFQRNARLPSQSCQPRDVQKLSRCAVRPGGIPGHCACESRQALDHLRQFANRQILARTYVDRLRLTVMIHEVEAGVGEIVHMQKLAA